jgi:catechol 2,3-dioxygenase-like lactoylglutathione lyase family enzyme
MTAFQTTHAFSGFSVDDIDAARSFYGDTLGLNVTTNAMGFLDIHLADGGSILVYAKPNHTPASFTILNFPVDDIDAAVDDLHGRGVVTKIYDDSEFATDEKGILRGGPDRGPDIAWFRDPAGNVFAVMAAS